VLRHDYSADLSITDTFRYASYGSNYRVSAPIFASDFAGGPPVPGTPLADILVYRDRPSSEGTQTYLTDHVDVNAQFKTGPFTHVFITGFEVGRQTTDDVRFDNAFEGVDGVAPTSLLNPNANETAPDQHTPDSTPHTTSDIIGLYATDQISLARRLTLDLGLRYDRYDTHFDDALSGLAFHRLDHAVSPKAALVFKPTENQTLYASYATSFDPASSYLTLAADTTGPKPETAKTYEVGAKARWLDGHLESTAAIFQIDAANVTVSDPDDPTLQELPGSNQRVRGLELTTAGHLTKGLEINVNYSFLDPRVTASADPAELGKRLPGAARNNANLWLTYEPDEAWKLGAGFNYVGQRYADVLNTASVPGYVLVNAMLSYRINPAIRVQLNLQNIADTRYFTGAYYTDENENHVLPGQGRVLTVSTAVKF
jgi:catecholate siderophore receptor